MAVRTDADQEQFRRTTSLPSITSSTMMGWFIRDADIPSVFGTYLSFANDGVATVEIGVFPAGTDTLDIWLNGSFALGSGNGPVVSAGWHHIALVCNGTNAAGILDGVQQVSGTKTDPSVTHIFVNASRTSTGGSRLNGRFAALKIYDAVLSEAEVAAESRYFVPIRTANLQCWSPCVETEVVANAVDRSGNGNNWTTNGSLTIESGPPIPWEPEKGWLPQYPTGYRNVYSAVASGSGMTPRI